MFRPEVTAELLNAKSVGHLPALLGVEIPEAGDGALNGRLELRPELLAPNGYLHAASVIALADTMAGYGTLANLPEGARTFTAIELKSNFWALHAMASLHARRRPCISGA